MASAFAVCMAAAAPVHAQSDLSIYSDAPLSNGWESWSWATVDLASTTAPHAGATSIAVTAAGWSALALRHPPFAAAGYGALQFWINGGPAGQARLLVSATVNDVAQLGVAIGPIAANTSQQISLPLSALGVDGAANLTGFWIQEYTGVDQTLNPFYVDDVVLTGSVPAVPPPPLDGGLALYDDSFVNGWQDWSWAAVNAANLVPVSSGASSLAVTATPYSALRFHHAPLDTHPFATVTFWINGGTTGGQILSLNALIGDVTQQPGVLVGPLLPNAWQKIVIPLAQLGADNRDNLTDIWLQEIAGVAAPTFFVDDVRLDLAPPPALVQVSVDVTKSIRRVDARTFGLNTAVWDGAFNTPTTVGLLNELENQALRFPGGSLSNRYHWQTNSTEGESVVWATPFDAFAQTATATHAQVFVSVNYGSGTPEEAAAWVRHSNAEKGYAFKYWEVGNENYGTWELDQNTRPHDPVVYATRFAEYARQMKAVDPSIKVGAVIQPSEDSDANYTDVVVVNPRTGTTHTGWSAVMLTTFRQLGVLPDFVAYHRYEQAPGGETDAFLLGASKGWDADATALRQLLNDYLGPRARRVEIDSTETNSVYGQPGKQTTSLVNGLFLADSIGNITGTEFNSCFWWDLRNGAETANNNSPSLYGWRRYGDYGIVNYAEPAAAADRYPTFYVYKLLKHWARGGELVVQASSDYDGLAVYAVRDPRDHTLRLLVINKNPVHTLNVSIAVAGFRADAVADVYSYGIPQDEAARTGAGSADVAQTTMTVATPTFTLTPAPYSATVLRLRAPRHSGPDHNDDSDSDNCGGTD